jgi:DNA helicase HerA-like ATPase
MGADNQAARVIARMDREAAAHAVAPIEALSQHVAIFGQTGGGKSYVARGLVEELLELGRRVCVVDYTGVWWGLRSAGDGPLRGDLQVTRRAARGLESRHSF